MLLRRASVGSWRGIELRHFDALEAVAACGSFTRAARELGYSQSAISQQIAALERIVGHALLERRGSAQPVTLTPIGAVVLDHARQIAMRVAAARADVDARAASSSSARVGATPVSGAWVLPRTVAAARRAAAGSFELALSEAARDDHLVQLLDQAVLDVAIVHLPVVSESLALEPLATDEYVVVAPASSPLARREARVGVEELGSLPLIALSGRGGMDDLAPELAAAGLAPESVLQVRDGATACSFVAAGVGAAILPALTVTEAGPVVVRETSFRLPPRVVGIAWSRGRALHPAAATFVESARLVRKAAQHARLLARSPAA